jgi:hypothetical protein
MTVSAASPKLLTLGFHPNAGDDEAREPVRQVHCDVLTCTLPCGPAATIDLQPVLLIYWYAALYRSSCWTVHCGSTVRGNSVCFSGQLCLISCGQTIAEMTSRLWQHTTSCNDKNFATHNMVTTQLERNLQTLHLQMCRCPSSASKSQGIKHRLTLPALSGLQPSTDSCGNRLFVRCHPASLSRRS